MSQIQDIVLHGCISKCFEHVGQEKDVCLKIDIVIVTQRFASEGMLYILSVYTILIRNMLSVNSGCRMLLFSSNLACESMYSYG